MKGRGLKRFVVWGVGGILFLSTAEAVSETDEDWNARAREDFSQRRFGIFIHWGLYSTYAQGEWFLEDAGLDERAYASAKDCFCPSRFDAGEWVSLFRRAGARYVTITARHHDGFSLWPSRVDDGYNIANTPFKRDVIGEMATACTTNGMLLNLYYSLLDWHRKDYPTGIKRKVRSTLPDRNEDYASYKRFMMAQITELIDAYRPGCIWFDGEWDHDPSWHDAPPGFPPMDWGLDEIYDLIHSKATLVANNHHRKIREKEDIQLFERDLPGENKTGYSGGQGVSQTRPLEQCDVIQKKVWGYRIAEKEFRTPEEVVAMIARASAKGSNLLLNIGPDGAGRIPEKAVSVLEDVGRWFAVNEGSIYGTQAGEIQQGDAVVSTRKGNVLYLHFLSPNVSELTFVPNAKVSGLRALSESVAVTGTSRSDGTLTVSIERKPGDDYDAVVEITEGGPAEHRILVCNEDNDRYFYSTNDTAFTEKGLVDYFDSISSGGAMTHYFMCVNGQRTSYASQVCEPIWLGVNEPDRNGRTNNPWCVNAKKLYDRGIDPYAVWVRRARVRGVSPWISMRMNDVHFANRNPCCRNETYFYAHPELKCKPGKTDWASMAWNYACPEVRERMLALVREILERWDVDGLELDWLRFVTHLPRGRERELAHHLTDFMREARKLASMASGRRGHPVKICVRLPTTYEAALGMGLEPETWAAEGLADWYVICNFFNATDFSCDFIAYRNRLMRQNAGIVVIPGSCNMFQASPQSSMFQLDSDKAFLRGWAALLGKDAPGLYLFNAFYHDRETQNWFLGGALSPNRVSEGVRRFPVSWHDVSPNGCDAAVRLPRPLSTEQLFLIRAVCASTDRFVKVVLGFDAKALKMPLAMLNGHQATSSALVESLFLPKDVYRAVELTFPIAAFHNGDNVVCVSGEEGGAGQIVWCELILGR